MKIFSWVHRRFHHKSEADNEDAKKVDNEKVALLENEVLLSACDGWKEGILVIGTLGNDLSKRFANKNNQVLSFSHGDDEEDQEEEMECPFMLKASKHGFHQVQKQDPSPCDKVAKLNNGEEDVSLKDLRELDNEGNEKKKIRKNGGRTTLADLLWADSGNKLWIENKLCDDGFDVHCQEDNTCTESIKSSLISKKKKIEKDDYIHPIKKTKRLMRKMLKKKIHPDIGSQKEIAGIICQERHVHAT